MPNDISKEIVSEAKKIPIGWLIGIPSIFSVVIPLFFKDFGQNYDVAPQTIIRFFFAIYFFAPLIIILTKLIRIFLLKLICLFIAYLLFNFIIISVLQISGELEKDIVFSITSIIFSVITYYLVKRKYYYEKRINILFVAIFGLMLIFISTTICERCSVNYVKAFNEIKAVNNAEENYKRSEKYSDLMNIRLGELNLPDSSNIFLKRDSLKERTKEFNQILCSAGQASSFHYLKQVTYSSIISPIDSIVIDQKQIVDLNIINLKSIYDLKSNAAQKLLAEVYNIIRLKGMIVFGLVILLAFMMMYNRKRIHYYFPKTQGLMFGASIIFLLTIPLFKAVDEKNIDVTKPLNSVTLSNWYLPSYIKQSVTEESDIKPLSPHECSDCLKKVEELIEINNESLNTANSKLGDIYKKIDNTNPLNYTKDLSNIDSNLEKIEVLMQKHLDTLIEMHKAIKYIHYRVGPLK